MLEPRDPESPEFVQRKGSPSACRSAGPVMSNPFSECDRPSPAKLAAVETAIDHAKFILDRIDKRLPEAR